MRYRSLLPIALLIIFPMLLRGQGFGALTGRVVDPKGNPFGGAVVEILKTSPKLGSYARNDGSYRVIRLKPGTYKVLAQVPPFRLRDTFTVTVRAGHTDTLDIRIDPRMTAVDRRDGNTDRMAAYGDAATATGSMGADFGSGFAVAEDSPLSISDGTMALSPSEKPASMPTPPPAPEPALAYTRTESSALVASSGRGATTARTASKSKADARSGEMDYKAPAGSTTIESSRKAALSDDLGHTSEQEQQRAGQLTAGEWSDLDNWPFWLDVVADPAWARMLERWGLNPESRVSVRVVDGVRPVVDAEVRLVDGQGQVLWTARSDNRGRAELFAGAHGRKGDYRVEVKTGGAYVDAGTATSGSATPLVAKLPGAYTRRDEFDLMFVVDATGSMGDEMSYIKAELESVINRNREATNEDLKLRLSCNFYRDRGDEYLVRAFEFDESTFEMIGHLRDQVADGGGDTPEAVEDALEDAIEKHAWSPSARARLMFLVLDAPPHYTPDRCEKIRKLAAEAAAKGIRIIPIASSGVDKETEFLLRLLGIYTGGTYTFLTDDSGIGGSHIKPTVGSYKVEYLNDLMVRVIGRYLAMDDAGTDGGSGIELH